ncbi:hypothetical protein AAULR_13342, partial [Lacticaseibacillus rhamnosus MTCC 5462]
IGVNPGIALEANNHSLASATESPSMRVTWARKSGKRVVTAKTPVDRVLATATSAQVMGQSYVWQRSVPAS